MAAAAIVTLSAASDGEAPRLELDGVEVSMVLTAAPAMPKPVDPPDPNDAPEEPRPVAEPLPAADEEHRAVLLVREIGHSLAVRRETQHVDLR